jgi:ABC-type Zn uptake system ZnuABC Zn-binding protein ZnuA
MMLALVLAATISVAATSTDLKDLVEAVGGDRVRVSALTAPQQDPHAREIHPGQLVSLRDATLLVRVGLDHEPWLARALASGKRPPHDLDCSRYVTLISTDAPGTRATGRPHVHAYGNPHYWLDPENARPLTTGILETLARIAPDDRALFAANRERFLARLDAGLARWSEALRPFAGTRLVSVHDTWPYLARRFRLVIAATVEEHPGVPPSAVYLGTIMERMRAARVRALVGEPGASPALMRRIGEGTGARAVTLAPSVGALSEATDYIALFDVNVRRLVEAFR